MIEIGFNFSCPRLYLNVSGDFSFKVTKKFGLHTACQHIDWFDNAELYVGSTCISHLFWEGEIASSQSLGKTSCQSNNHET